jgi:hypothetical protein
LLIRWKINDATDGENRSKQHCWGFYYVHIYRITGRAHLPRRIMRRGKCVRPDILFHSLLLLLLLFSLLLLFTASSSTFPTICSSSSRRFWSCAMILNWSSCDGCYLSCCIWLLSSLNCTEYLLLMFCSFLCAW